MSAVLSEADMHGEGKHVAPSHGCANRLLSLLGGYTDPNAQSGQLGRLGLGREKMCGAANRSVKWSRRATSGPTSPKTPICSSSGARTPRSRPPASTVIWPADSATGCTASALSLFSSIPALNYSGVCQADKWIPISPQHGRGATSGHRLCLADGGHIRKRIRRVPRRRLRTSFLSMSSAKRTASPKRRPGPAEKCGVPEWTIKALWRATGPIKLTSVTHGNGGPGIRGPFSSEPGRLEPILLGMRGLGKPGVHQVKWLEWNLFSEIYPMPYQGIGLPVLPMRAEIVRPPRAEIDGVDMESAFRTTSTPSRKTHTGGRTAKRPLQVERNWHSIIDELAGAVQNHGYPAAAIHSEMPRA